MQPQIFLYLKSHAWYHQSRTIMQTSLISKTIFTFCIFTTLYPTFSKPATLRAKVLLIKSVILSTSGLACCVFVGLLWVIYRAALGQWVEQIEIRQVFLFKMRLHSREREREYLLWGQFSMIPYRRVMKL